MAVESISEIRRQAMVSQVRSDRRRLTTPTRRDDARVVAIAVCAIAAVLIALVVAVIVDRPVVRRQVVTMPSGQTVDVSHARPLSETAP